MASDSTLGDLSVSDRWVDELGAGEAPPTLGLCIAWCLSDPSRIGEVLLVAEGQIVVVGRGEEADPFARLRGRPQLPGPPLQGRLLSRRQLEVTATDGVLHLRNVGSCALKVQGRPASGAALRPGQAVELDRQLVLVAVRREPLPDLEVVVPFGGPDPHGIVGESAAAWELRARLRFLARRSDPVLVVGSSGTGKELAARAVHGGSERSKGPFVARNAATLPESLVDAELFGNARNYPNPGMADRTGLIGAAHGGTLFLDEIGEMPVAVQAHLLRVLDRGGTYQRLGETRERSADFRFVAATNRDPEELKHDLIARMPLRLEVPGLGDRPEDVPLLVAHLLGEARADPELAERLFDGEHARIAPALILALLGHRWTTHVRELGSLLWRAIETSPGRALQLTPEVRALLDESPADERDDGATDPEALDAEAIRGALDTAGGSVTAAARELGLSSRYVLYRLMKRHGLD